MSFQTILKNIPLQSPCLRLSEKIDEIIEKIKLITIIEC